MTETDIKKLMSDREKLLRVLRRVVRAWEVSSDESVEDALEAGLISVGFAKKEKLDPGYRLLLRLPARLPKGETHD